MPSRSSRPPEARSSSTPSRAWLVGIGLAAVVVSLRSADVSPPAASPGLLPIGSIVAYAGPASSAPVGTGWMLCDGRELAVSEYPELHGALGFAWGRGKDASRFRIPDLRGRFLRGVNYDASEGLRDPDRDHRGVSATGGNAGNEVGSLQEDAAGPHGHPLTGVADAIGQGHGAEWIRFHASKVPDDAAPVLSNSGLIQSPGPSETRPRNVYVNWIVRVR